MKEFIFDFLKGVVFAAIVLILLVFFASGCQTTRHIEHRVITKIHSCNSNSWCKVTYDDGTFGADIYPEIGQVVEVYRNNK